MLVLTTNQTKIDSTIIDQSMEVWEEVLEEAQAKFGDRTLTTDHPCSDYLLGQLRERLSSRLSCEEDLLNAIVNYFNQSELIENGCLSLGDLSLAGRESSSITRSIRQFLYRIWFI